AIILDKRPCILDLTRLESVDSTGIALLMRLQQRLQATGAPLILLGVGFRLRRILKRMQWDAFFSFAPSQEEAVHLIDIRSREQSAAVEPLSYRGTSLAWRGEITAANVAEVWARTQKVLFPNDSSPGVSAVPKASSPDLVIDMSQ